MAYILNNVIWSGPLCIKLLQRAKLLRNNINKHSPKLFQVYRQVWVMPHVVMLSRLCIHYVYFNVYFTHKWCLGKWEAKNALRRIFFFATPSRYWQVWKRLTILTSKDCNKNIITQLVLHFRTNICNQTIIFNCFSLWKHGGLNWFVWAQIMITKSTELTTKKLIV